MTTAFILRWTCRSTAGILVCTTLVEAIKEKYRSANFLSFGLDRHVHLTMSSSLTRMSKFAHWLVRQRAERHSRKVAGKSGISRHQSVSRLNICGHRRIRNKDFNQFDFLLTPLACPARSFTFPTTLPHNFRRSSSEQRQLYG